MRLSALVLLTVAIALPAAAQTTIDDLHIANRLAAQQELARQRMLAAEREALVLETRARTAAALSVLREQRLAMAPLEPAPLDPQMAAQAEAIAKLQGDALARSNARILAITEEGARD